MCGITGIVGPDPALCRRSIANMTNSLVHRGPDKGCTYLDYDHGQCVALGHRRLSILDLSENGAQPKSSPSGRYVIVFNGEIYNFLKLKSLLLSAGNHFSSTSDTEVITIGLDQWGIENTIEKLKGMFAIAIYDKTESAIYLVRDRLGEKPLYYGWVNNYFVFSSEIRAIRETPGLDLEVSKEALTGFVRFGYVPAPFSILKSIYKLPAGCILSVPIQRQSLSAFSPHPVATNSTDGNFAPKYYWNLAEIAAANNNSRLVTQDFSVYTEKVETLITESIEQQLISDVPIGAFLSSGVDSSLVVSIMQSLRETPVNTFTIGFEENEFNEAPYAKEIANHLGTNHTELYVSANNALDLIPNLYTIYDEPFADASQLPTRLLCELAKTHISVCLTGDGGDELFCGYNRYIHGSRLSKINNRIPYPFRLLASNLIDILPNKQTEKILDLLKKILPSMRNINSSNARQKIAKLASGIKCRDDTELYLFLLSYWNNPGCVLAYTPFPDVNFSLKDERSKLGVSNAIEEYMLWDQLLYLPDDNLVKTDRAAMSVSLETRVPLLASDLAEYTWQIPRSVLLHNGRPKAILRAILEKHIPQHLIDRPKMGFSVPLEAWIRDPLKEWGYATLFDNGNDFFDRRVLKNIWNEHQLGTEDHSQKLWTIMNFNSWLRGFKSISQN